MTADASVLERIFDRLVRTLSAGGPDQLRAPFSVAEIVQALVPYRTYRNELGVDTLQDYEHAVLELLSGERGWLICDPDTVAVIKKELASPDPDTGLLRRLQTVEVRMGAIRMPILSDIKAPIDRADEPASTGEADAKERIVLSDAIAIGAAMDREDDEMAQASVSGEATLDSTTVDESSRAKPSPADTAPSATSEATSASTPAGEQPKVPATLPSLADLPLLMQHEAPATAPLHAMHGVTVANAQMLSRITPLSVPSVYGDPIEFRGVRHAPVDVGGVIFLFGMVARELGFNVEAMSSGFPRCEAKRQIAPGKWARLRIDFELESRQFRDAGRNPAACDLIVCWRDTWPDRPASLDVLSLERMLPTLSSRE